jgi:hypothetical protein
MEGRSVVDAVAHVADGVTGFLEDTDETFFFGWRKFVEKLAIFGGGPKSVVFHGGDVLTRECTGWIDANVFADVRGDPE